MNEQKATSRSSIEWTRILNPDGTFRRGFTWNPIGGCMHDCKWTMPDGQVAQCYAKSLAENGLAKSAYKHGFEHHYWRPHALKEPLRQKEPAGIFLDSMSDLMGHWVPTEQIQQVLDVCREADWHIFQLLTKNPKRLTQFEFPDNVWVGVSSPPDFMWGKGERLSRNQQVKMLEVALESLAAVDVPVTWMSFEPLSWNVAEVVKRYPESLKWAVIGAASNGRQHFPPSERDLRLLLDVLDNQNVPVFFKGNLKSLPWAAENWREDFPIAATGFNFKDEATRQWVEKNRHKDHQKIDKPEQPHQPSLFDDDVLDVAAPLQPVFEIKSSRVQELEAENDRLKSEIARLEEHNELLVSHDKSRTKDFAAGRATMLQAHRRIHRQHINLWSLLLLIRAAQGADETEVNQCAEELVYLGKCAKKTDAWTKVALAQEVQV